MARPSLFLEHIPASDDEDEQRPPVSPVSRKSSAQQDFGRRLSRKKTRETIVKSQEAGSDDEDEEKPPVSRRGSASASQDFGRRLSRKKTKELSTPTDANRQSIVHGLRMSISDDFLNSQLSDGRDEPRGSLTLLSRKERDPYEEVWMVDYEHTRHVPLFSGVSEQCFQELGKGFEQKVLAPGSCVLNQGETADNLIVVVHGALEEYTGGELLREITDGGYLGELAVLGLETRSRITLTVAEEAAEVAVLHRSHFEEVIERYPEEGRYYGDARRAFGRDAVSSELLRKSVQIFRGLSISALESIELNMIHRLFFPGEYLLEQGTEGEDLFLVFTGDVSIEVDGKVIRQMSRGLVDNQGVSTAKADGHFPGAIAFGELGLLNINQTRTASVRVDSPSHVGIVYRPLFLKILENYKEGLEVDDLTHFLEDRYKIKQNKPEEKRLRDIACFKEVGCSDGFLDFLADNLQERIYLAGQRVVEANAKDDDGSMYVLCHGAAKVCTDESPPQVVATLKRGDIFGEAMLLGLVNKRSTNVVADTTCFVKIITRKLFVRGLELHPDEKQKVLMLAYKKKNANVKFEDTSLEAKSSATEEAFCEYKAICKQIALQGMGKSPHFARVGSLPRFIEELAKVCVDRIYLPGEFIIEEGMLGDSMFVMISGSANVHMTTVERGRSHEDAKRKAFLGVLEAGSISGELCMLGVANKRNATIEADTICSMWEVSHDAAMPIIQENTEMTEVLLSTIVAHLESTVPNCIDSIPAFTEFGRKFRMLIGLYCERRAYFAGSKIFRDGKPGDHMHVLNLGRATLERRGVRIETYDAGAYFNASNMLGLTKVYLCTLACFQTCHVIIISRAAFLQTCDQYPSNDQAHEFKKKEKNAYDQLKKKVMDRCGRAAATRSSNVQGWLFRQSTPSEGESLFPHATRSQSMKASASEGGSRKTMKSTTWAKKQEIALVMRLLKKWHDFAAKQTYARSKAKRGRKVFDDWVIGRRQAVSLRAAAAVVAPAGMLQPISALLEEAQPNVAAPTTPELGLVTPRAQFVKLDRLLGLYTSDPRDGSTSGSFMEALRMESALNTPSHHLSPSASTVSLMSQPKAMMTPRRPGKLPALSAVAINEDMETSLKESAALWKTFSS